MMRNPRKKYSRQKEWTHVLLKVVSGFLLFETITGLIIFLFPFSLTNQVMVLMHTLAGLVFIIPYLWYQVRHWLIYQPMSMNHFKLSGYILMVITLILSISGLILTWQAIFGTRISPFWDTIHLAGTFGFVAFAFVHVGLILIRDRRAKDLVTIQPVLQSQKNFSKASLIIISVLILTTISWTLLYNQISWNNELPGDYSYYLGEHRPFAPSLARTSSGGALDPRSLAGQAQRNLEELGAVGGGERARPP